MSPILDITLTEAQLNKRALLPIFPTQYDPKKNLFQNFYNEYAILINGVKRRLKKNG